MIYKIVEKFNVEKHFSSRVVLFADVLVTLLASLLSITFVSIVARNEYSPQYIELWLGCSFGFSILAFLLLKTSTVIWRHSSSRALGSLL